MKIQIIFEDEKETLIKAQARMVTDAAILVTGIAGADVWLPLSQVEIVSDNGKSDADNETEILVPNWLIEKKPLV